MPRLMCPEGRDEDIDDDRDEDQGGGGVIESVEPPLFLHLIEVEPSWGEGHGKKGEREGPQPTPSAPQHPIWGKTPGKGGWRPSFARQGASPWH